MGGFRYAMLPFVWIYNKTLFGQYSGMTAVNGINKSGVPVLVIHGTDDKKIGYDKSSIISEKEKITNPNAKYLTLDGGGHNDIFYAAKALEYIGEFNKYYRAVYEQYNGEIPEDVLEDIYSGSDRELMNTPNEELLSQIESFFLTCPTGD